MIIDRSHVPWAIFVTGISGFCSALYIANVHPDLVPVAITLPSFFGEIPPTHHAVGATPLGIVLGSVALAIFVFAALLGARKKKPLWRIGHPQLWLKAHIWLTILTIPLVLFHSGFRLGGPMTMLLAGVYTIVMGSGFFGLALQQFMPSLMRARLPEEVVFEQIPYIRSLLVSSAEKLRADLLPKPEAAAKQAAATAGAAAAASSETASAKAATAAPAKDTEPFEETLIGYLDTTVIPYLKTSNPGRSGLAVQANSDSAFRLLKVNVPEKFHANVDDMQQWCDSRRTLDLQLKMHHWLHGWLLLHIPFSLALIILTVWHAIATLFFF
jgi:hypothetical protein